MLNEEDPFAGFKTAAAHLRPGGIFITNSERFVETLSLLSVEHATQLNGESRFCRKQLYANPP